MALTSIVTLPQIRIQPNLLAGIRWKLRQPNSSASADNYRKWIATTAGLCFRKSKYHSQPDDAKNCQCDGHEM